MSLVRVLEPEVMDTAAEAVEYDTMDHAEVNRRFAEELLAFVSSNSSWLGAEGSESSETEMLDLGTGTARIPIEICRRHPSCRIVAVDLSTHMLDLARYNIEAAGVANRIMLAHVDAKGSPFASGRFPIVISNSIVHHIPSPATIFAEIGRLAAPGAAIFVRDLLRPESDRDVERIVAQYAGLENDKQQSLFRASLHAALTLDEVRHFVRALGYDVETVLATSDRHWTWAAIKHSG